MIFVTKDGVVTSEDNIRATNPLVSFPSPLKATDVEPFGYQVVQEVAAPTASPFVTVQSGALSLVDGIWTQTWIQTSAAVADAQTQLLGTLASTRHTAQIAPVTIDGVTVNADSTSIALLSSALSYLSGSDAVTVNFKAVSGWVTLTVEQLQAFSSAIATQIQRCFSNEYAHTQKIMALNEVTDLSAYDITTGW